MFFPFPFGPYFLAPVLPCETDHSVIGLREDEWTNFTLSGQWRKSQMLKKKILETKHKN